MCMSVITNNSVIAVELRLLCFLYLHAIRQDVAKLAENFNKLQHFCT